MAENSAAVEPALPSSKFSLRHAERSDARAIRRLIYLVGNNPLGLDWRHFWIVTADSAGLVACGQIKVHRDGSRELASIAVSPEFRGMGLARVIIEKLLRETASPTYLTCRASLGAFYNRFGFQTLSNVAEMPLYFQLAWRAASIIRKFIPRAGEMLVMRRLINHS